MATLDEVFETFIEQLRGQSTHNRRNYRRRLREFLAFHGRQPPAAVTPADVNRWHRMLVERGYREATLAGYRQSVKALFNYCRRQGLVAQSPAAHLAIGSFTSRRNKRPPEADVQAARAVARAWLQAGTPAQVRDAAIFLLGYTSGPRLREIRELRLSETEESLRRGPDAFGIYRAVTVGKTKEVVLRYDEAVAAALRRYLAVRPPQATLDVLFVTSHPTRRADDRTPRFRRLSRRMATRAFRRVSVAAGLKKPILSHALRHRLGDLVTRQHGPKVAAMVLNHKDQDTAGTAIAFYHHPDESDVSRALRAAAATE